MLRERMKGDVSERYIVRLGVWIVSTCLSLFSVMSGWSAEIRTQRDAAAEQEFKEARPELSRLNSVLQNELARLLSETADQPSPELTRIMTDTSKQHPRLDDTAVPLRLRLIERERLAVISGVEWARNAAGHCGSPEFSPAQLVDPVFRKHMEKVIECRRQELDRYQVGMHKLNKANEATVLELKLPPFTESAMLSQARAATGKQDTDLEPIYRSRRVMYQSMDDLFQFMDAHSSEVHFAGNNLTFDNDADSKIATDLINKFLAAGKALQ